MARPRATTVPRQPGAVPARVPSRRSPRCRSSEEARRVACTCRRPARALHGAKAHSRRLVRATLTAATAVAFLGGTACVSNARVPPAQLPVLLANRSPEVRVRDVDGEVVTIDRNEVAYVSIEGHPGFRLMTGGTVDPLSGAVWAAAFPEGEEQDAQRRGWASTLDELEGRSFAMTLRGDTLLVDTARMHAAVRLQDVAYVQLKEAWPPEATVLIVVGSMAAAGGRRGHLRVRMRRLLVHGDAVMRREPWSAAAALW